METETLTLTEFLLARIAKDESEASGCECAGPQFNLGHSATCPARVLAECEAKRRIVDLHAPYTDVTYEVTVCQACGPDDEAMFRVSEDFREPTDPAPYPCRTLMLLATVYADHPDFRPEWRP